MAQTLQVVVLRGLVAPAEHMLLVILLPGPTTKAVQCIVSQLMYVMLYRVVETDGMGVVLVILKTQCYMEEAVVARIRTQLMLPPLNRLEVLVGVQPAVQVKVAAYQSYRCSHQPIPVIAALA